MPEKEVKVTDIEEVIEDNEFIKFNSTFICPHCNALATHEWSYAYNEIPYRGFIGKERIRKNYFKQDNKNFFFAQCPNEKCKKYSIWLEDELVYPDKSPIPPPNPDLNRDMKRLYNEASTIYNKSPRASSALLRLCLEMLCEKLGATDDELPKGETRLSNRIRYLVNEKGLDPEIAEAFHSVRHTGNEALHTGEINSSDNKEIAKMLFEMINIIAEDQISKKKKIKELHKIVTKPKAKKS